MPAYAYFMLIALAISYAYRSRDALRLFFGERIRLKGDAALSLPERWAIAAGADLAVLNAQYVDALSSGLSDPMQILREWWNITSRVDALETLHDLANDADAPEEHVAAALAVLRQDGLHHAGDPPPSLHAWNLARLINICRWCYDANLLTQAECWSYVLPAARNLQREYASWAQLSTAYLFGYLLWQQGERTPEYNVLKSNREHLLESPQSPWRTLAWTTPLNA